MDNQKAQVLAAVNFILSKLIERRMSDVPMMFKPMLAKFSPESLTEALKDELTDEDWETILNML